MITKQQLQDIQENQTTPDLCQRLDGCKTVKIVPKGTRLITAGVPPNEVAIVCSGSVEISLPALGRAEPISIGTVCKGFAFGVRCMVSGALPDTNVTCREECSIAFVPKDAFLELLRQNPSMYSDVIKVLSAELRFADELIRRKSGL